MIFDDSLAASLRQLTHLHFRLRLPSGRGFPWLRAVGTLMLPRSTATTAGRLTRIETPIPPRL